jgi:hypothetical protein
MRYLFSLLLLIIIRHDSSDINYVSFGKNFQPYLASINLPDCEGTIIGENLVITAAHCAVEVEKLLQKKGKHSIIVNNKLYPVSTVKIHPKFKEDKRYDIALIWFKTGLKSNECKVVELNFSEPKVNDTIYIAGRGMTGNGKKGVTRNDGKLRAGKNLLDFKTDFWLGWRFDSPKEQRALQLEAISGPGDSGGPAFVQIDNQYFLVGISSWQSTMETKGKASIYGVTEFYTRISTYEKWICSQLE